MNLKRDMEKKRVEKRERYWYIDELCRVFGSYDGRELMVNQRYKIGNYFPDRESAEAMASKLRAVLNGADVIETPSEEEFNTGEETYIQEGYSEGEYCHKQSFCWGFQEGIEWLKSKIIK